LNHFDTLPGSSDVRRKLADFLIAHERTAEAEIELLEMSATASKSEKAAFDALLVKMQSQSQPHSDRSEDVRSDWLRGPVTAQVLAATSRESRRENLAQERQPGHRPLRIEQDFWPSPSDIQWLVSVDCTELVGRDVLGNDVYHLNIDQNNWARQYRDSGLIYAARLGHLLFVALSGQIMAIDTRQKSAEIEGDFLWRAYPMGRYFADAMRSRRPALLPQNRANRRPVYHSSSDRKRMPGLVGTVIGSLGPVTPRGVVFQEQNQLKCVDPLSGETLWSRTDIRPGCELFGDREFVFAADVSEQEAYVIRMIDGKLLDKRPLPRYEWLLAAGRNIAQMGFHTERDNRAIHIKVTDIWSQETLFDSEFSINSKTSIVEPNAVAICEPSGRFQLIDVRTGNVIIDQQLEALPDLHSIHAMRSGDTLFVVINTQLVRQQQHKPIGQFDYPIASGLVYAFAMSDGQPLWPGPATIRNRGVVYQPDDIPFLVFADRQMSTEAPGSGRSTMRLLCLDKRTGETVYRNDQLPDAVVTRFRIRGERDARQMVTMHTNAGTIQLTMTDGPRPPRPPANDDLEAVPEKRERGLVKLGERMGAALRGTIERDANDRREPQETNGQPAPVDAPQQKDDD
jgi:outer membrane protein assembly factor BamB